MENVTVFWSWDSIKSDKREFLSLQFDSDNPLDDKDTDRIATVHESLVLSEEDIAQCNGMTSRFIQALTDELEEGNRWNWSNRNHVTDGIFKLADVFDLD